MLFFPWWVYACIIGIIFCAYKLMTTAKRSKRLINPLLKRKEKFLSSEWSKKESADDRGSK